VSVHAGSILLLIALALVDDDLSNQRFKFWQGRSQGVARVAKATHPVPSKKKLQGKNNSFYLQHSHCTVNCTQSFNGGEKSWLSYDAKNPPIWHPW